MKTRLLLAALACGMFTLASCKKKDAGGGGDSTEYEIKLKQPSVGSTMHGSIKIQMHMGMDVTDGNGRSQQKKDVNVNDEITYRETILEWPDKSKKPTRSTIVFEKWDKKGDKGFGDEGVRSRIVGREVLFQKFGREYEFHAADGTPIDPNVRIFLEERYNELFENFNANDFLPGKPVRKNSSWDIDVKKLLKAAMKSQNAGGQMPLKTDKAKGTGSLTDVSEKDGRKYGTIELRVDFGELDLPKEQGLKISKSGRMELIFTIEACIDGSLHDIKASAKMQFGLEATHPKEGGMKMDVKFGLDIAEKESPGNAPVAKGKTNQAPRPLEGEKTQEGLPPLNKGEFEDAEKSIEVEIEGKAKTRFGNQPNPGKGEFPAPRPSVPPKG